MERITLLPHGVLTNVRPGFYDTDSGTTIEQTAKVYAAMRELQSDYNKFVDEINKCITEFVDSINKNQEEFEVKITKIIHDYIKTLDLKIAHQDRVIEESIVYIKENLSDGISQVLNDMKESGELSEIVLASIDEMVSRITDIETNVNTNTSDINTLKTKVNTNTSEVNALKNEVNTNTSEVNALKNEVNTNTSEVNALTDEVNKIKNSEIVKYEEEIEINKSLYELEKECIDLENTNKNNNILRVATFNIENEGAIPYRQGLNHIEKTNILRRIMLNLKASFIGLNESFNGEYFPIEEMYTNRFNKYCSFYSNHNNIKPQLNAGNSILSSISKNSETGFHYVNRNGEYNSYLKNEFNYNGKLISFYVTHLDYTGTYTQAQCEELANAVLNDTNPYKIIVGDFNFDLTNWQTYFPTLVSSGFKVANGGTIKTYDDSRNIGIDEIMVSSNINILDKGTISNEDISDHFPLYAELELI